LAVASFDDGKDEGALRTIGELGDALGIKAHVLRYWEGQFPTLQPLKRSGGRRYYRPEDVALVREIDRLVNREGYTLRGAKAALKYYRATAGGGAGAAPATADRSPSSGEAMAAAATAPATAETVTRLRAIRARLAEALAS
jgi:DNA-binding transcriptional MerR regulator